MKDFQEFKKAFKQAFDSIIKLDPSIQTKEALTDSLLVFVTASKTNVNDPSKLTFEYPEGLDDLESLYSTYNDVKKLKASTLEIAEQYLQGKL